MSLHSILTQDCTKCSVLLSSKKKLLEYISAIAHQKLPEIPQQQILESLINREKLGSTAVGKGIALPHGRISGISHSFAILLTTAKALDYDAFDNQAVDIFCAVIIPEQQSQQHLHTLADIAQLLNNKPLVRQLRHANSAQELYQLITTNQDR